MLALFPTMRICAAALSDIAYAASTGVLLNRLWLGRISTCNQRLRICLGLCSAVLLINLSLQFLLLCVSMTGDNTWQDAWQALPDVAATHSGRTFIVSLCLAPCLLVFSLFPSCLKNMRGVLVGMGLELAFLASRAFSGHAASDGDFTLREGMQFLHLSSIAMWGGGVVVAGLITLPYLASTADPAEILQFTRRLSRTVTVALAIVVLTGIYNSWKGLGGSLSLLPQSAWGRMLLLKVSLVLLVIGHGARVRLLLKARGPWTQGQTTIMRRWVRTEALLMLFVLACSAWLANLPPADM